MAEVLKQYLRSDNVRQLILCKTNIALKLPTPCVFLRAVFTTWASLHIHEPTDDMEIIMELLWLNDYIKIRNQTVLWHRWMDAGIIYVNDLLHPEETRFMSHEELSEKYGITITFLELLQIRSAIPCLWKRKIANLGRQEINPKPNIKTSGATIVSVTGKSSKTLYYSLIKRFNPTVTSQTRWNEMFPRHTEDQEEYWATIYKTPYKAARDTKLQAFHYRIVHRFIPCNKFLCNIKIKRNDVCSFCPEADTIEHFLFYCPLVVHFWKGIITWFDREADIHLVVSLRAFLFGIPDSAPHSKIVNFILLFGKFFIYRQKLFHHGSLDLVQFLRELKVRLNIEKYLAKIEDKQRNFQKWRKIYEALG